MTLEEFLNHEADRRAPIDPGWPDRRIYQASTNPDAIEGDRWLENGTSYIWRIGVLAQIDSNKCDYARLFIAHEREPGWFEFIGELYWQDGESDDIGRSLARYLDCARQMHPVFDPRP